jgi:protocatechuate 3,4-dioxygenase beta subunit
MVKLAISVITCFMLTILAWGQEGDVRVGGPCDGCALMFEGMPATNALRSEASLMPSSEPGAKMDISGTVFAQDGTTPAKDIIIYLYQTNAEGRYTPSAGQTAGRLHGHLRGWVKTDAQGKFTVHTIRPAPYPNGNIPAHIHILVKEPGKSVYYIDEVWFNDDPFVTEQLRRQAENRGGNQIIALQKEGSTWRGTIRITLGLNIPGYP